MSIRHRRAAKCCVSTVAALCDVTSGRNGALWVAVAVARRGGQPDAVCGAAQVARREDDERETRLARELA
jgi:hypothetical protein